MAKELSAIPLQPEQIQKVTNCLSKGGLQPHIFQNLDAWEEFSELHRVDTQPAPRAGDARDLEQENCLLLIGSFTDMVEHGLLARINAIHPGLPIIAVGESPSLSEVVKIMRQGVADVVDLSNEPNGICQTVEDALRIGRKTASERQRVRMLRQKLATLTRAELEVLDEMLNGLSNKETAKKLGIGLRTVELRRAKIMTKMGAKSVAELVKFFCQARCPGVDTRAVD